MRQKQPCLMEKLDYTCSASGQKRLRFWLRCPLQSVPKIEEREELIATFLQQQHRVAMETIRKALCQMKNVPWHLEMLSNRVRLTDWQHLLQFAQLLLKIKDALKMMQLDQPLPLITQLMEKINVDLLTEIVTSIASSVDFEQSQIEGRTTVLAGIDDTLDAWKEQYERLSDVLLMEKHALLKSEPTMQTLRALSITSPEDINVVYIPNMGFLTTCKHLTAEQRQVIEEQHAATLGWHFQFTMSEGSVSCFKTPQMLSLDDHYGDILLIIFDREVEILQAVAEKIQTHCTLLKDLFDLATELDAVLSLAEAARLHRYVQPVFLPSTASPMVHARNSRHPLLEDNVVENDITIGLDADASAEGKHGRTVCLTGANFSGKSVYLKQVALLCVMAHIGSFVPATSMTLTKMDKVYTRMHTSESASRCMSSFLLDLEQIAAALRGLTPSSLVLLDEPFKGTSTDDGVGLLCGLFHHIQSLGQAAPLLMIASHFHECFQEQLSLATDHVAFYCMKLLPPTAQQPDLTFLYKVVPGRETASYGTHCARLHHMPEDIIQRAEAVSAEYAQHGIICRRPSAKDIKRKKLAHYLADLFLQSAIDQQHWRSHDLMQTVNAYIAEQL